jgi:death-on-curing protein
LSESSKLPHYYTVEEAKEIHKLVMEYGQSPQHHQSLRLGGENILGSALARPQQVAYYEGADVIRQASLLCISVSQAQAFVDGNKRTAFAITEAFLNSISFTIADTGEEVAIKLIEVAVELSKDSSEQNRERVETEFEDFLRSSIEPFVEPKLTSLALLRAKRKQRHKH